MVSRWWERVTVCIQRSCNISGTGDRGVVTRVGRGGGGGGGGGGSGGGGDGGGSGGGGGGGRAKAGLR